MNLYIQIENGKPINHPSFEDNLLDAFGLIPENFIKFNRIQQPVDLLPSPFYKAELTYILSPDGTTCQDNWIAVEMSTEEKNAIIDMEQNNPPYPNAVFNITDLAWAPPEKPTDDQKYQFNYKTGIWTVLPEIPSGMKKCYYDFEKNEWQSTEELLASMANTSNVIISVANPNP